jgi:glutamate synthase (NADPH/NADH) small chain
MAPTKSEDREVDRKGRMKLPFEDRISRPPEERVKDFEPTYVEFTPEKAKAAAELCIHCPDPAPCYKACPVHNDISGAMWLIYEGDFIGAAELYRETSSMPEICGLVCPHDELCMGSCVRFKRGEPVLTGVIENFVTMYQREHSEVVIPVGEPTGKKVAIVGSGPAGLGCAEQLVRKGHQVTVFEAKPTPGGLLIYGIPNFKLAKKIVDAVVGDLKKVGVEFLCNTPIGLDKTVDSLFEEGFDAVFIGIGTGIDASMKVPGIDLPGIHQATEFLIRTNVPEEYLPEGMKGELEVGKRVAVIGGGDTASDCLRSALRLGSEEVICLYRRTEAEMPGNASDRKLAKEEGAKYRFLTQPVEYIAGPDGRVSAVECLQCELGEPDDSGRRRPIPIEGSNFTVPVDTVVLALGYWPDDEFGKSTTDLETHDWGLITVDPETMATSRPGVFAGGDAVTGPDLVVTAMGAGRTAAASIDEYLSKL